MSTRTDRHERWLSELTGVPTVAGREDSVVGWINQWVGRRRDLRVRADEAGNLLITRRSRSRKAPVLITAHLDHPGFVVLGVSGRTVDWQFLGGVAEPYFEGAAVEFFDGNGQGHRARVLSSRVEARVRTGTARLVKASPEVTVGAIGRWAFRAGQLGIRDGLLFAPACDDLAGAAAALAALDELRKNPAAAHVGVLLTRAEEVGFIGAIAASRNGMIARNARLVCIEMSRSFADSPIGAGPIVRVGDASSVFSPELTNQLSALAREVAKKRKGFAHQRKLMAGGSCEATAFSAYGFESSCLCLPLGNYHNMIDIDAVAAGSRPARVGPEFISLDDFHGLVRLIAESVVGLDAPGGAMAASLDEHYEAWKWVLP